MSDFNFDSVWDFNRLELQHWDSRYIQPQDLNFDRNMNFETSKVARIKLIKLIRDKFVADTKLTRGNSQIGRKICPG